MTPERPPNRLIREKSPYLRQHARNPVDWYPWGEEAFERARREGKPVFLSIGYSSCHWCHVMERESFEDPEAARLLNETFVCVKVDREERPDIDQYFMTAGQMLTGAGGWPLTIVMTPDKRPFFAGTYFPKERRWGRPGLMEIVPRIAAAWRARRDEILRAANGIVGAVVRAQAGTEARPGLTPAVLDEAFRDFEADFDERRGGFGSAPKFPVPHNLSFLLRYAKRTGNARAMAMAEKTLERMRLGGIRDHLGGGFHRYSTDEDWLVPHFEKMLYDQALLAFAYAEAHAATGRGEFGRTAAEILDDARRDFGASEGGFFTAEDADSEGKEGRFYLWTKGEIEAALDSGEAGLAVSIFGAREEGNFTSGEGRMSGLNILYLEKPLAESAAGLGMAPEQLEARVAAIKKKLLRARGKRVRPFRDTKILADWNGLAIGALAKTARVTGAKRFLEAAGRAARFVLDKMRLPDGRLLHASMEGEARIPAYLDDYAFLIGGLIELYETGFDLYHLERALELMDIARTDFADSRGGGFFSVGAATELPVRAKEITDGAVPSGNSVMLMNLLRLARLTGGADLEEAAGRLTDAFADRIAAQPRFHAAFLCGLDYAFGPAAEVVIVGRRGESRSEALLDALARSWLPNALALFKPAGKRGAADVAVRLEALAPFTREMKEVGGSPAAYVCANGRCLRPAASVDELLRLLVPLSGSGQTI
jgi:uncharacterized protein YyaL (SSP411 family)